MEDRYTWKIPFSVSFTLRLVLYPYCCRVLFDGEGSPTSIFCSTSFVSLQSSFRGQTPTKYRRYWTVQYAPGSSVDRISSPSRVYIVRTVFSAIPGALYLGCMIILGSSRLITGPKARLLSDHVPCLFGSHNIELCSLSSTVRKHRCR